ncbi:hypothetical protein [Streptomyces kanasensis]|uniref:hypothetical protein n=1 Tax=Streptomyces kanasensis TaxID=936756 RepID=UPI0037FF0154
MQHPCAAWPMQMLRCTRATALLQPEAPTRTMSSTPATTAIPAGIGPLTSAMPQKDYFGATRP